MPKNVKTGNPEAYVLRNVLLFFSQKAVEEVDAATKGGRPDYDSVNSLQVNTIKVSLLDKK